LRANWPIQRPSRRGIRAGTSPASQETRGPRPVAAERSARRAAGLADRIPEDEIADHASLVIAIGGDGTLLYAARLVAHRGVPLLGINRGRLGFLTDVLPQDMLASVDAALEGRCERTSARCSRLALSAPMASITRALALNDVVLQKWETGRMLDFETWIDGAFVNTHGGDGLVVASSTGSTAYALSCGGPIVAPHLDVLVVAPICPHTLSDRPIVVSGRSVIVIKLIDRPDTARQVTCDGVSMGELAPGDRLEVHPTRRKSRCCIRTSSSITVCFDPSFIGDAAVSTNPSESCLPICRFVISPSSISSISRCVPV
jgi:NAD+ kinase